MLLKRIPTTQQPNSPALMQKGNPPHEPHFSFCIGPPAITQLAPSSHPHPGKRASSLAEDAFKAHSHYTTTQLTSAHAEGESSTRTAFFLLYRSSSNNAAGTIFPSPSRKACILAR